MIFGNCSIHMFLWENKDTWVRNEQIQFSHECIDFRERFVVQLLSNV